MKTNQLSPSGVERQTAVFLLMGLSALVALIAAIVAVQLPVPALPASEAAPRPTSWSPGGHITGSVYDGGDYSRRAAQPWSPGGHITGSVYDGGDYGVWQPATPAGSGAVTVTGLAFDGTRYVTAPVTTGAGQSGSGYTVTAPVYDGTAYRTAPVLVAAR